MSWYTKTLYRYLLFLVVILKNVECICVNINNNIIGYCAILDCFDVIASKIYSVNCYFLFLMRFASVFHYRYILYNIYYFYLLTCTN